MIFNLWALISVPIIFGVGWVLDRMFPVLFEGPHANLAAGLLVTLVGAITELLGIRGRLAFLPVWLIGILMTALGAHAMWGWPGVIIPVGAVLFWGWWMIRSIEKKELQRLSTLAPSLSSLEAFPENGHPADFWRFVRDSLFLPSMADYTPEMRLHDLRVAEAVLKRISSDNPTEEEETWRDLRWYLDKHRSETKRVSLDGPFRKKLNDFISARLKPDELPTELRSATDF